MQQDLHLSHKRHRNALYALVVLLAIIQTVSFIVLSMQVSKINAKIDTEIEKTTENLKQYTTNVVGTYNSIYQENFNQISSAVLEQQKSFDAQIKLLKSAQSDFSGVVEDVVRGVVTIRTDNSIGTGFFVSSDGYLVTNFHVIQGGQNSIEVITYDKDTFDADIVAVDETRDLALLQIPGTYTSLELAKDNEIQVGKKVIAIGNPLGLSFTVTEGIVSGINRVGPSGLAEYVQTDVPLNPGNSGGPLIDTSGKVIGINNFKIGGAENLGFSLKSSIIKEAVNSLVNKTLIA